MLRSEVRASLSVAVREAENNELKGLWTQKFRSRRSDICPGSPARIFYWRNRACVPPLRRGTLGRAWNRRILEISKADPEEVSWDFRSRFRRKLTSRAHRISKADPRKQSGYRDADKEREEYRLGISLRNHWRKPLWIPSRNPEKKPSRRTLTENSDDYISGGTIAEGNTKTSPPVGYTKDHLKRRLLGQQRLKEHSRREVYFCTILLSWTGGRLSPTVAVHHHTPVQRL